MREVQVRHATGADVRLGVLRGGREQERQQQEQSDSFGAIVSSVFSLQPR